MSASDGRSVFQEMVALNIPYCNEFCIFANPGVFEEIHHQLQVFQCLPYRLFDMIGFDEKFTLLCVSENSKEKAYVLDSGSFDNIIQLANLSPETYKKMMIQCKKSSNNLNRLDFDDSLIENSCKMEQNTDYHESIVKLSPAFKDYLWGGTKLRDIYHKPCDFDIIAESWELSAHQDGQSIVASGKYAGMKFDEYINIVGKDVLGWKCKFLVFFPLLVKFIDAKSNLSVQVHPNDDYALEQENQYGKNEMWYVIDSEPGAGLYVGFKRDVSRKEIEERVKNNTIMEVLNFFPTKPGDVFYIPAGTVHAIGEGNLICEIQQSSNCTYRLYDYDRRDKYGNPRELHLQKALDVLNYNKYEPVDNATSENTKDLCLSKYFKAILYEIDESQSIELSKSSFTAIQCLQGNGKAVLNDQVVSIEKGECLFIHASDDHLEIIGNMKIIKIQV